MFIKRTLQPELTWALYLGFATFITNAVVDAAVPGFALPIGNVFIFCSAICLGLSGALISCVIGLGLSIPIASDPTYLIRTLMLAAAIAITVKKYPSIPPFFISFAMWFAVIGPILSLVTIDTLNLATLQPDFLVRNALGDIMMTVLAGVLLLNRNFGIWITQKPRHTDLTNLIVHIAALTTTTSLITFLVIVYGGDMWLTPPSDLPSAPSLFGMIFLTVNLPMFVGWGLASILSKDVHQLFAPQLFLDAHGQSFSGASSEYWRRRSSDQEHRPEDLAGRKGKRSISESTKAKDSGTYIDTNQGLLAISKNGTVSFVNRRFTALAGASQKDIIGKNIRTLGIREELVEHILGLVDKTFEKGPTTTELKLNVSPNLRYFEIASMQADAFASLCEGPDSVIITMKDITDRRAVELHLLKGQRLSSLGKIVRGLAHSFNNTLTQITARASFAKYTDDKEELKESMEIVLAAAQEAGELVRHLIDFADGEPTLLEKTDLGKLVEGRLSLIRKLGDEKLEITFERSEDLMGASCDPNQIIQALTNLVLNSIDSYEGEGKVAISLDTEEIDEQAAELSVGVRAGKFVRLRVKDTGSGMIPEVISKAFDPLFTTRSDQGNAGLGLSIVYAIARAHDGFLTVESKISKGTSISLYLPFIELTSKDTRAEKRDSKVAALDIEGSKNRKEHILVVEDETHVRSILTDILSELGFKVTSCADGMSALKQFQSGDFDLVLIDMIMPQMNGLELLGKLKEHDSSVKTLAMSGYGLDNDTIRKFSNAIPKPFDIDSLVKAIKITIDEKSSASKQKQMPK